MVRELSLQNSIWQKCLDHAAAYSSWDLCPNGARRHLDRRVGSGIRPGENAKYAVTQNHHVKPAKPLQALPLARLAGLRSNRICVPGLRAWLLPDWEVAPSLLSFQPGTIARLRVVVLDDNVDAAETLKELLELSGCDAVATFDGDAGLHAVRVHEPELVISDLNMPNLDGREFVKLARQTPAGHGAKFVCLSAAPEAVEGAACLQAGFDCYIEKPITAEILEQLILSLRRQ